MPHDISVSDHDHLPSRVWIPIYGFREIKLFWIAFLEQPGTEQRCVMNTVNAKGDLT